MKIRISKDNTFLSDDELDLITVVLDGDGSTRAANNTETIWIEFESQSTLQEVTDFCTVNGFTFEVL